MELSLLVIASINFLYVCILPFIFFRKDGSWNIMWCLTASPYVIYPILLTLGYMGKIDPLYTNQTLQLAMIPVFVLSIITMAMTVATHTVPLSLWHQSNDAPVNIVKHGPYSRVRHPFYTSFILALIAGFVIFPHIITGAITIAATSLLTFTAKKEEKNLSSSEFGQEYIDYMKTTGRFFPKLL